MRSGFWEFGQYRLIQLYGLSDAAGFVQRGGVTQCFVDRLSHKKHAVWLLGYGQL